MSRRLTNERVPEVRALVKHLRMRQRHIRTSKINSCTYCVTYGLQKLFCFVSNITNNDACRLFYIGSHSSAAFHIIAHATSMSTGQQCGAFNPSKAISFAFLTCYLEISHSGKFQSRRASIYIPVNGPREGHFRRRILEPQNVLCGVSLPKMTPIMHMLYEYMQLIAIPSYLLYASIYEFQHFCLHQKVSGSAFKLASGPAQHKQQHMVAFILEAAAQKILFQTHRTL